VRGAIRVRANDKDAIHTAAVRLAGEIVASNQIEIGRIISIICTLTPDLTVANPATGLRLDRFGEVPLFCVQEAAVEGGLPRIVRLLVTYRTRAGTRPQPVYLDGAERLRSDLAAPAPP
jgi:chorismate mutase